MFSFSRLTPNAAVAASVQLRGTVAHFLPEAAVGDFKLYFELFYDTLEMQLKEQTIEARGRVAANPAAVGAKAVIDYIGDLKSLTTLARPALIGAFDSLRAGLDSPERQQSIADAGAGERYVKMCDSFDKLSQAMQESAQLESEQSLIPCSTAAKFELCRSIKQLYEFVHIFSELGNPDYTTPASEMDELLEKFRPMMNQKPGHQEESGDICEEPHCSDHETEEPL